MLRDSAGRVVAIALLATTGYLQLVLAQEPGSPEVLEPPTQTTQAANDGRKPATRGDTLVLPVGTRLPLSLVNGIRTGISRPGDSVYFQTIYPVARDDRIAIPIGSFVRGRLIEAKRPGRVKGRGEFRIGLEALTFSNGYTVALNATPRSVDTGGSEAVKEEGKIQGGSSIGKDVGTVAATTLGGTYIGTTATIGTGNAGKGALIGSSTGAIAGLAFVLLTRGPDAELPRGTTVDVVLDREIILETVRIPLGGPATIYAPPAPVTRQHQEEKTDRRRQPGILWPLPF